MNPFIKKLMLEHEHGLVQLGFLEDATKRIIDNGFSAEDLAVVKKSTEFISVEIKQHNQNEENYLFPLIENYIPNNGPTHVMKAEHRLLWEKLEKLNSTLLVIEKNKNDVEIYKEMRIYAHQIVELLSNHIHKENNILFPMAEKLLSEEELNKIAEII